MDQATIAALLAAFAEAKAELASAKAEAKATKPASARKAAKAGLPRLPGEPARFVPRVGTIPMPFPRRGGPVPDSQLVREDYHPTRLAKARYAVHHMLDISPAWREVFPGQTLPRSIW